MKHCVTFICFFVFSTIFSQQKNNPITRAKKIEDHTGHLIKSPLKQKVFFQKLAKEVKLNRLSTAKTAAKAVYLCSNSNFEEFETIGSENKLKNFLYTFTNPRNPTQCATPPNVVADQYIPQYDPSSPVLMATTVPANHFDEFIGNIQAFDQFALKINHKESINTSGVVQAKRFKTNNEKSLIFNYKAVLESIPIGHENEQPFFKARIIDKNDNVVDEFCLIGDVNNCIYSQITVPGSILGSIVLYTQKWQTGMLDISSLPNNEEFMIEFTAARCGLTGHFGYVYIDDLCLSQSNENLQGSIELDPLYQICPSSPVSVCGKFTMPNSGGISSKISSIKLNLHDDTNKIIFTQTNPKAVDLVNSTFCFELLATNFPNVSNANYNVGVEIKYDLSGKSACSGVNFESAEDNDANPGSDISFLNCSSSCNFKLNTGELKACDNDGNGQEDFDLTQIDLQLIGTQKGLKLTYFATFADATFDANAIANPAKYTNYSSTLFARVESSATCFKIIAFQLLVKNPKASISGILNICNGSTVLTASPGVSHLWSTGETTPSISVNADGIYSVKITDKEGCKSEAQVTIIPTNIAASPDIEVIQPTCSTLTGSIIIKTPAAEYSFDDGATWSTSNSLTNLMPAVYQVKTRTVNNCYSYTSNVVITPFLSMMPSYTVVNPTSCDDTGSITITSVSEKYSFDNGATWTTNNTKTGLPFGTYIIRIIDADGCFSNANTAVISGDFLPVLTYEAQAAYCSVLGYIKITSPGVAFSIDGGNDWQSSNLFPNLKAGSYILKARDSKGCTTSNFYIYLENFQLTYPYYTIDEAGCNKYATVTIKNKADFYSFDNGFSWSAQNFKTNLKGGESLSIQLKMSNGCTSYSSTAYINSSFRPLPVVTDFETLVCDNSNDNSELVDLTLFNARLTPNPNNATFKYYTSMAGASSSDAYSFVYSPTSYKLENNKTTLYAVIQDNFDCSNIAKLTLNFIETPIPTVKNTSFLCENYTVDLLENKKFDSYLWSTGQTTPKITVNKPSSYSLTVTETHGSVVCSTTQTVNVILSNPAVIKNIKIDDWTDNSNILSVNVTGLGDYEYALNGKTYQDRAFFSDLISGEYTVFVRDKQGCGVVSENVYVLMYPKFFTPNADGHNDYWKLKFANKEANLKIHIYDRYGKLLAELDNDSQGWDGNHKGQPLPADDYWFSVTRPNGKIYKEHFTLKR